VAITAAIPIPRNILLSLTCNISKVALSKETAPFMKTSAVVD
jgi:hypothetical protein